MCCSIATCKICLRNRCFEACDKTIIIFISLTNENKNSEENSDNSNDLQEPHDSDDDVTVDGDFFLRIKKKMYEAMIQMILLECVTHLTLNLMIYQNMILRIIL